MNIRGVRICVCVYACVRAFLQNTNHCDFITEDGKLLDLDCENLGIKSLVEECDRHSRALQKQADLADA